LAVTYLILNRIDPAKRLLNETLSIWPDNGFALVHYGFILKTSDNNMKEGVEKMMAGIRTKEPGVIDGRFFFHLGDALNR
jgi:aspartate beta-hydroxylase